MVLQVHDELVLEVPKDDLKKVAKFVKDTMENIYQLPVPLVADMETGKNWGKLERLWFFSTTARILSALVKK